jgi:hypothetical protein
VVSGPYFCCWSSISSSSGAVYRLEVDVWLSQCSLSLACFGLSFSSFVC